MSQTPDNQFDLAERTAVYGEQIIVFCQNLEKDSVNRALIYQVVKSGTSIGANYTEADCAESRKDFRHKIALSRKEARETMYWMRMIKKANPELEDRCNELYNEAEEFVKIFSKSISTSRENEKKKEE